LSETTLTAFYDLELAPVSFDFSCFLMLAEMERLRRECSDLHVVIVPAPNTGDQQRETEYDDSNKRWRLHNILVPHIAILPNPASLTICSSRHAADQTLTDANGPIFPQGYDTQSPTTEFMWSQIAAASARGETIPSYRASAQAKKYMEQWLTSYSGDRLPISITLRESSHAVPRNSNLESWYQFADRLDRNRFYPVIVRDTEKIFGEPPGLFDGFTTCPQASLNLDLRIALYESCYLNLMLPGGPMVPCWLNDRIRFLNFKIINEDWPNTTTAYVSSQGLKIGGQLPHATPYQRLVWEPDDLEVIEREFDAMVERIGEDDERGQPSTLDPQNTDDPMEVALRLQMTGRLEEATAIYQDIVGKDPDNADAWHLLGLIAHQADRPEAAEKMILRAIGLTGGQANYFVNLAAVLKKAERLDEAANSLWRAIALSPNDAGAHADLAELLADSADGDKAKSAMLKALKLKPGSIELCERAGRLFHNSGDIEIAANLYRQALDLRKKSAQRRMEAMEQLPELPVQTLKTA